MQKSVQYKEEKQVLWKKQLFFFSTEKVGGSKNKKNFCTLLPPAQNYQLGWKKKGKVIMQDKFVEGGGGPDGMRAHMCEKILDLKVIR